MAWTSPAMTQERRGFKWLRGSLSARSVLWSAHVKSPATRHEGQEKGGLVIGRASFGKISAVEGIRLTRAMKNRAADAESKELSAEEYRQTICGLIARPSPRAVSGLIDAP
jgi:hypothetical protein